MRVLLVLPLALGLFAAGCVTAPDDAIDAASIAPDGTLTAPQELVTISETGATWDAAYVCSPVAMCMGTSLAMRGGPSFFDQSLDGILDGAELVLTWDAATPQTEQLVLGIAYEKAADEWDYVTVSGSSPLTLSQKELGIPADKVASIYVNSFACAPTPITPCASTSQEFTIEGTLALLPVASEPASASEST